MVVERPEPVPYRGYSIEPTSWMHIAAVCRGSLIITLVYGDQARAPWDALVASARGWVDKWLDGHK